MLARKFFEVIGWHAASIADTLELRNQQPYIQINGTERKEASNAGGRRSLNRIGLESKLPKAKLEVSSYDLGNG